MIVMILDMIKRVLLKMIMIQVTKEVLKEMKMLTGALTKKLFIVRTNNFF